MVADPDGTEYASLNAYSVLSTRIMKLPVLSSPFLFTENLSGKTYGCVYHFTCQNVYSTPVPLD